MKKAIYSSLIMMLSLWTSCDYFPGKPEQVLCSDIFQVTKDLPATMCDIKIQLDSIQDSRCPDGVNCVRAGEAIANLTFKQGNEQISKSLQAAGRTPKPDTALIFNRKVILLNVTPYPVSSTQIQQKDYKVQMKLE